MTLEEALQELKELHPGRDISVSASYYPQLRDEIPQPRYMINVMDLDTRSKGPPIQTLGGDLDNMMEQIRTGKAFVCPDCGGRWDIEHNRCTLNPEHCT